MVTCSNKAKKPHLLAGHGGYRGGSLESEVLLRSVVVAGLWLVVAGLVVTGLLVVAVAGALIDGLHSGWIGIAHGLIAVGALLLLLHLKFHLEQLNFLLLLDES